MVWAAEPALQLTEAKTVVSSLPACLSSSGSLIEINAL